MKTRSDLLVSFQQSHSAALSTPGHKSQERCGMQRHNSGFFLLWNDWWNNVWQEVLWLFCFSSPLYCHSCPFYSPSPLVFFFACLSLSSLILHHSWLFCSVKLMPFRGQMPQSERCFIILLLTFFLPCFNSPRSDFQNYDCALSLPNSWVSLQGLWA